MTSFVRLCISFQTPDVFFSCSVDDTEKYSIQNMQSCVESIRVLGYINDNVITMYLFA